MDVFSSETRSRSKAASGRPEAEAARARSRSTAPSRTRSRSTAPSRAFVKRMSAIRTTSAVPGTVADGRMMSGPCAMMRILAPDPFCSAAT